MCSILGMGFQYGSTIKNNKCVHDALSKLFVQSQSRGRTSTGVAITNRKDIIVVKDKMSADRFVLNKAFTEVMRKYLDFDWKEKDSAESPPISVLGHCRFPTKGSAEQNTNNHPIVHGGVVGVHNGGISNDEELWIKFDISKHRKGIVDSEIIFGLIEHFIKKSSSKLGNTAEAIVEASSYIRGGYACAMVNNRNPYCVWLFRNHMPCVVRHYYRLGLVVWSSTDSFLQNSITGSDLGPYEEIDIPQHSGLGIDLYRSSFEKFKLNVPSRGKSWIA